MTDPPDSEDQRPEEPPETPGAVAEALARGIGGTQGLIDSGLPTAVFLVVYLVSGSSLAPSLWAALGAGVVVAVIRKLRGESLQHIAAGLLGVGIAAFIAARTGRAEDFFLPGLLLNIVYGLAFAISALVRYPLAGYAAGAVVGDLTGWRSDPAARRAATAASWLWAGMFLLRVAVQVPLYLAGAVEILGVAKLAMGWPLFIFAAYLSYRILGPTMSKSARGRIGDQSGST